MKIHTKSTSTIGDGMKQTGRVNRYEGQLIGLSFKEGGFMPCEDDEDLCDVGSGAGPGDYTSYDGHFDVIGGGGSQHQTDGEYFYNTKCDVCL